MNIVEAIEMANNVEQPQPTVVDLKGQRWIKGIIISLTGDGHATALTRSLIKSIKDSKSRITPLILDASTPTTYKHDLNAITYVNPIGDWAWTYPAFDHENRLDLKTGLYMKAYRANDIQKVIACMVSHMRAWQMCIDMNEPIMVLEQDAYFQRRFTWEMLTKPAPLKKIEPYHFERWMNTPELQALQGDDKDKYNKMMNHLSKEPEGTFTGGILGLNSPLGATRKASIFHDQLHGRYGFHRVPSVDRIGDDPLPQGLAGNSAYIIKPWAAKKVLEKVAEVGMWPNDAIMCKQFFPWMQTCWPYFTAIQKGTISTTTG